MCLAVNTPLPYHHRHSWSFPLASCGPVREAADPPERRAHCFFRAFCDGRGGGHADRWPKKCQKKRPCIVIMSEPPPLAGDRGAASVSSSCRRKTGVSRAGDCVWTTPWVCTLHFSPVSCLFLSSKKMPSYRGASQSNKNCKFKGESDSAAH